jgi:hypothetical protein
VKGEEVTGLEAKGIWPIGLRPLQTADFRLILYSRVARFVEVQHTKTRENIPNDY